MANDSDSSAPQSPIDDALMAEIRDCFFHVDSDPVSGPRIFLESGGGSLLLKAAIERSSEIAAYPDSPSRRNSAAGHIGDVMRQTTKNLHRFFGAESGQVLYGATGTEILFRLVRAGLENADKGSVLSSSLEHAASHDAAHCWAQAFGHEHVDIPLDSDTGVVSPQDYADAMRPDTRLARTTTLTTTSSSRRWRSRLASERWAATICWSRIATVPGSASGRSRRPRRSGTARQPPGASADSARRA